MQSTKDVFFVRDKIAGLHHTESQSGDAATKCSYQHRNDHISIFWYFFICLPNVHRRRILSNCTEAMNETLPCTYRKSLTCVVSADLHCPTHTSRMSFAITTDWFEKQRPISRKHKQTKLMFRQKFGIGLGYTRLWLQYCTQEL